MYCPEHFRETDTGTLVTAINALRLGTLVSIDDTGPTAVHVPCVVKSDPKTEKLELQAHVARNNPFWKAVLEPRDGLAVFLGPHTYASPNWYPTKKVDGRVVPTWLYISVHAKGPLVAVQDRTWLQEHLEDLTKVSEAGQQTPWSISDAPAEFTHSLIRGIVGIKLVIDDLYGAWKLNQHKSENDKEGTQTGLSGLGETGRILAIEMNDRSSALAKKNASK